jgi:nucleoside-diphosphate-sugar epimerase
VEQTEHLTMRVVVTGAAGLVGQNLIARLRAKPGYSLLGIDKHATNTALLARLHPGIEVLRADLADSGPWQDALAGADAVVVNQAQIGGLRREDFIRNNLLATERVLEAAARHRVPYLVQVSSSVVNSRAQDFYVETKAAQEALARASGLPLAVLRPTLMFGWFDRKHLGWLRRFMDRSPVFPVPGSGHFLRQPLYAGDFAAIIDACLETRTQGVHDVSGLEQITYIDLIRLIREIVGARCLVLRIPCTLFRALLATYARIDSDPPFTTKQLEALVLPETFPVVDWPARFGVRATPLREALEETFLHPAYSRVVLDF